MQSTSSRRAFVVGAHLPQGGAAMAYHLGRILEEQFGFAPIAVQVNAETGEHGVRPYGKRFPIMTIAEMEKAIGPADVLVCNPSFSRFRVGLRLPGLKICYVQGFTTYGLLDRFDHYVAVSGVVARYLKAIYGLEPRVISPFVDTAAFPRQVPWWSRPPGSILTFVKGEPAAIDAIMGLIRKTLARDAPDIDLGTELKGISMPQAELLRRVGAHRHLLMISPAEGFGLLPLEAMGMGATVAGLDGFGGRDYMRPGENCAVAAYPDIEAVAANLIGLVRAPDYAARLAEAGQATAAQFTHERFRRAWIEEFQRIFAAEAGMSR